MRLRRGLDAVEELIRLHPLLDEPARRFRGRLGSVGHADHSRAQHKRGHFGVDGLGARARGELPGDPEVALDDLAAERGDPVFLDDRRQILKRKISGAISLDVMLDLIDHLHGIARNPLRRPHVRRRTISALIRTAARGENRDRYRRRVHPSDETVVLVSLDIEKVPGRARDAVDFPAPRAPLVDDNLVLSSEGEALHARE